MDRRLGAGIGSGQTDALQAAMHAAARARDENRLPPAVKDAAVCMRHLASERTRPTSTTTRLGRGYYATDWTAYDADATAGRPDSCETAARHGAIVNICRK